MASTATAARWRGRGGRLAFLHEAEATTDDATHGFAGLGMLGERFVGHALLELENLWLG